MLEKILAAELGCCIQCTMFISSMHIFFKNIHRNLGTLLTLFLS